MHAGARRVEHRRRVAVVESGRAEPRAGPFAPSQYSGRSTPKRRASATSALRRSRAARRRGRRRPFRRVRSRSRCPRMPRPDRPRRPCRPSPAASRRPRRSRARARATRRSAGTAPSTSRRCRPEAPNPAISRSSTAMRSAGVGLRERVRRPEPGQPAADDADVEPGVRGERRARARGRRVPTTTRSSSQKLDRR